MSAKRKRVMVFAIILILFLIVFISNTIDPLLHNLLLDYPKNPTDARNEGVTKIIHQSWKTKDVPKGFYNYSKSWTKYCFKDWVYMFWTDEDNLNLIKNHYPWFLDKYNSLPTNIYRADVSRYFYLFHYGGIYTDLDNECLRPFEHLLMNYSLVFGAMEGQWKGTTLKEGYVQNSFMYSTPRNAFWLEVIHKVLQFHGWMRPELYTGPVMLSNKIKEYRDRPSANDKIIIYPPKYFNPFSWIIPKNVDANCKTHNGMSPEESQKCRSSMIAKGCFVVQYHAHTWNEI